MRKGVWFSVSWLTLLVMAALLAPFFLSHRAGVMDFTHVLEPPTPRFPLGTDSLGRDLLSRLVCGAGVSMSVALVAVALSVVIGILVGAVAGYYGGMTDRVLMAWVDIFLCFPAFFLILAVSAILGPNIFHVMAVIGATGWMGAARLVRAEILSLKEREFILASRALGAGSARIIFTHLVPNAAAPVIVNAVLGLSGAILIESGLSFLGIGIQPPTPSWGNILMDGRAMLGVGWWLTFFPGAAIFLTVLSANILGEELHRKLHP